MKLVESRFFQNNYTQWVLFVIRIYLGWQWLVAGWQKLGNPAWTGKLAGSAVNGFLMGALQKTNGEHPDVLAWYAYLIKTIALPNVTLISYIVVYGEILVGLALLVGIFTRSAAVGGAIMNFNYLLAGSVGLNPIMLLMQIFIIAAGTLSGRIGLDFYIFKKRNEAINKGGSK